MAAAAAAAGGGGGAKPNIVVTEQQIATAFVSHYTTLFNTNRTGLVKLFGQDSVVTCRIGSSDAEVKTAKGPQQIAAHYAGLVNVTMKCDPATIVAQSAGYSLFGKPVILATYTSNMKVGTETVNTAHTVLLVPASQQNYYAKLEFLCLQKD